MAKAYGAQGRNGTWHEWFTKTVLAADLFLRQRPVTCSRRSPTADIPHQGYVGFTRVFRLY